MVGVGGVLELFTGGVTPPTGPPPLGTTPSDLEFTAAGDLAG